MKVFITYCVICLTTLGVAAPEAGHAQFRQQDSSWKIYKVNPWVSGGISVAGGLAGLLTLAARANKPHISDSEFAHLDRNNIPSFDRWVLNSYDLSNHSTFETYSLILQIASFAGPISLLFDNRVHQDWANILLMAFETNMVTVGIYSASPLGPLFVDRYRPRVYLDRQYNTGNDRASFYSGHVADVAASSFFTAKVYTDYHPELGANKYWYFAAAAVPPLVTGYLRLRSMDHFLSDVAMGFTVGTLCGILIPELHRISNQDVSMGVSAGPSQSRLTFQFSILNP